MPPSITTVAARHGLEMEAALDYAKRTYVDVNIFDDKHKARVAELKQLPVSCWESAEKLIEQSEAYKMYDVFPQSVIDGVARKLKTYEDKGLRERLEHDTTRLQEIVNQYFHCG